uniref:Uncharacterized protein n=1 Tax=Manihot esculenta TaxID=3983 RepID=A0A2C9VIT7_MANES
MNKSSCFSLDFVSVIKANIRNESWLSNKTCAALCPLLFLMLPSSIRFNFFFSCAQ